MSDRTHSTENYWGSTITLAAEPQSDGKWSATATLQPAGAAASTTLHAPAQPTAEAAMAAARALATSEVDARRTGQGKP